MMRLEVDVNPRDYAPIVERVREYVAAEMDAASPAAVVAYCETNGGEVVELTLSDLASLAYLATTITADTT